MSIPLQNTLWDFSVAIYSRPGVKTACLDLQKGGLDVNVALWIVWTSLQGRDPIGALGQAIDLSTHWSSNVVHALRQARDNLKASRWKTESQCTRLRRQILDAELNAEKIQQGWLEAMTSLCASASEDPKILSIRALRVYSEQLNGDADPVNFAETIFSRIE